MIGTIRVWVALAILLVAPPAIRAGEPVDLLLVFAADVSRSIDEPKFKLQRDGYAAAIVDKRVLEAIAAGPHRRIAICFVEWSGAAAQKLLIDWMPVSDEDSARRFADRLAELPRSFAERTSISAGIDFSLAQFARSPYDASRRTIDVSGDGTNNAGRDVTLARDEAVEKGATINGLVILSDQPMRWNPEHTNPPGGLAAYFRDNVVGGPGAFVVVAENFNSFGQAILKKLIAEIAQAEPRRRARKPNG